MAGNKCYVLQFNFMASLTWLAKHRCATLGKALSLGHSTSSSSSSLWRISTCERRFLFLETNMQEQWRSFRGILTHIAAILHHPGGVIILEISSTVAQHTSLGDWGQGQQTSGGLRRDTNRKTFASVGNVMAFDDSPRYQATITTLLKSVSVSIFINPTPPHLTGHSNLGCGGRLWPRMVGLAAHEAHPPQEGLHDILKETVLLKELCHEVDIFCLQ